MDIYARVSPDHKLKLVEKLKDQGHIVAVTGDGMNDAPALQAAHLGVAMGKAGTEVAREAADMVLTDDNFASITNAVEEGRVVFANIRKVTYFLLSTGIGLVITILSSSTAVLSTDPSSGYAFSAIHTFWEAWPWHCWRTWPPGP